MSGEFEKCRKPDCMRKVKPVAAYCCTACTEADEGGYEIEPHDPGLHWILTHSASCDQRSADRGEFSYMDMLGRGGW